MEFFNFKIFHIIVAQSMFRKYLLRICFNILTILSENHGIVFNGSAWALFLSIMIGTKKK